MANCPVCGGDKYNQLLKITHPDRFELSLGISENCYERKWVECSECGVALNILPDISREKLESLRASYYEVDFMGSCVDEKYTKVMAMPARQSDNVGRVKRVINFSRQWFGGQYIPRVMDIGAGTGVFLSRLVDETGGQWECLGLEPDPNAANHLRKVGKFTVVEAMFDGQSELHGYNIITLNKVLEHIENPKLFLQKVVKSLNSKNAFLYIEVPDKSTTYLRPANDNILGSLHCNLYDPFSLSRLIQQVGLEVLSLNRISEPSGKLTVYAFAALAKSIVTNGLPHDSI
jgi:hypothetical protein